MTKSTILITLCLIFSITSFAQSHTAAISGKIVDGGDQKIIDAATVSLYKNSDSSLVKINITDKAGNFEFQNLKPGKYYLLATSIGHLATYSQTINAAEGENVSVGDLKLNNDSQNIKGHNSNRKKTFYRTKDRSHDHQCGCFYHQCGDYSS